MPEWLHRLFDHAELDRYQFDRSINAVLNPKKPELFEASAKVFKKEKVIEDYNLRGCKFHFILPPVSRFTFHFSNPQTSI